VTLITKHFDYWPNRIPKTLTIPETTIYDNLLVTARRYPHKTAIYYYGATYTFKQLLDEVNLLAGYLEQKLGVEKGDKILLYMQNSPQFIISYYAILRANAVVVPINPMNKTEELGFFICDSEIKIAIIGQEMYANVQPLLSSTPLNSIIIASYYDYLSEDNCDDNIPQVVTEVPIKLEQSNNLISWREVMNSSYMPLREDGQADDLAVLPYTSGTTGVPKGCMHTNRTVQANTFGGQAWVNVSASAVFLMTLPLFHVTGMVHSMHIAILAGATTVVMTRWDREYARCIMKKEKVTHWTNISTMLIDFLANPKLEKDDLSSLVYIGGGGAPLPEVIGEKLYSLTGLRYVEGYGLTETISQTHFNPPDRPKLQCLGIPSFDVDARIIDPQILKELPDGEEGEIIVNGPQVFVGYYNREEDYQNSYIEIDGKSFFRTGDIGKRDEEGYYFIVDRVKRMINASGYKVWPTEVESILYKHPSVLQACVIGAPDPKRGETVKAFIVLKESDKGQISEEEIIEWSKSQMAAYKYPRYIEFRNTLPMTTSGKLLWRKLQEEELESLKKDSIV